MQDCMIVLYFHLLNTVLPLSEFTPKILGFKFDIEFFLKTLVFSYFTEIHFVQWFQQQS